MLLKSQWIKSPMRNYTGSFAIDPTPWAAISRVTAKAFLPPTLMTPCIQLV